MVAQINTAIAEQERACNEIQRSAEGMRMMGDAVISATHEQRTSRDQLAGAVDRVGARSEQILAANRIQRDDRKTIIQALAVFRTSADSGLEHVRDLNRIAVGLSRQAESLESESETERAGAPDPSIADFSATDDR